MKLIGGNRLEGIEHRVGKRAKLFANRGQCRRSGATDAIERIAAGIFGKVGGGIGRDMAGIGVDPIPSDRVPDILWIDALEGEHFADAFNDVDEGERGFPGGENLDGFVVDIRMEDGLHRRDLRRAMREIGRE